MAQSDSRNADVAFQLASIDNGAPIDTDDPRIPKYERALTALARQCPDADKRRVGDMIVKARDLLADKGVDEDTLSLMKAVQPAAVEGKKLGVDCAETIAATVVLTTE